MARVGDLSDRELASALRKGSLRIRTGPFVTGIRSPLGAIAEGLRALYGDFPTEAPGRFVDFRVHLAPVGGIRRWLGRQVVFRCNGRRPYLPFPRRLAMPLFEWGWNWCVYTHAHRYLVIHAAVVARGERALLLPAPTGSGKSTLCAGLVQRGWRLLGDDLALLRPEDGAFVPIPRPISLKNDSIQVIRRFAPAATMGPAWPDTRKGTITHLRPPADSVARAGQAAGPSWVVFPQFRAGSRGRLVPHSKAQSLLRLATNAFNYSLLGATGFQSLVRLIEASECYEFEYEDLGHAVELLDKMAASSVPLSPLPLVASSSES